MGDALGNPFGVWPPVHDRDTARYAVRMAGLPVLIVAANTLVGALVVAVAAAQVGGPQPDVMLAVMVAAGLVLLVIAFALRAGRSGLVPLATAVSLLAFGAQAMAAPVWSLLVPLLALLLALSGLRGWLWLRRNPA